MKIQIRDRGGLRVTKIQQTHVVDRLGLAFGRFGPRVERVLVRFSAVDGEQCCHIEVALRGPMIQAEGLHGDRLAAVDQAVARAAGSITRALEREVLNGPTAAKR